MDFNIPTVARKAVNILFVGNPEGTSLGAVLGGLLSGIFSSFEPILKSITWFDATKLGTLHFVALGIFLFNIGKYLKRNEVPIEIFTATKFIEDSVRSKRITKQEGAIQYAQLIRRYTDSVMSDELSGKSKAVRKAFSNPEKT